MLGCPASDADLIEWSKELGSDITFFLSKGTAYCTGRGEILEPLPALAASNSIYIVKVRGLLCVGLDRYMVRT